MTSTSQVQAAIGSSGDERPVAAATTKWKPNRGSFQPGNPGGPGNPFARRVAQNRKAMLMEANEADLRVIARGFIDQAKQGDLAAAKFVCQYCVGKGEAAADEDPDT